MIEYKTRILHYFRTVDDDYEEHEVSFCHYKPTDEVVMKIDGKDVLSISDEWFGKFYDTVKEMYELI